MKKFTLIIAFATVLLGSVRAWDRPGFEWSASAELTSAYLWRGQYLGGLSLQPSASVSYAGLGVEAWFNLSPADYKFKQFAPEMDLSLYYSISAITIGVNHQFYFDGSHFFGHRPTNAEFAEGSWDSSQTEVYFEFDFAEWFPKFPLAFMWGTYIAGNDYLPPTLEYDAVGNLLNADQKLKRAYSSYFEFSYKADLPLGFSITPTVGFTPWRGMYNFYDGKFSVNNINLRADWEFEFTHHFRFDVYAQVMFNTYGLNKDNIFTKTTWRNAENGNASQHLNGSIGVGIFLE